MDDEWCMMNDGDETTQMPTTWIMRIKKNKKQKKKNTKTKHTKYM